MTVNTTMQQTCSLEELQTFADKMKKLNWLDQALINAKIEALYERQLIDESEPQKTG